jgi:hypothetical protein
LSLCLASVGAVKTLSIATSTLVWTHAIEKVDWQQDWRITPKGLELVQARAKGSGAGMEPPPEARLVDGWFQWRPSRAPMPEVCGAIPAPPANGGCAAKDAAKRCAKRCRRYWGIRSAWTPQR